MWALWFQDKLQELVKHSQSQNSWQESQQEAYVWTLWKIILYKGLLYISTSEQVLHRWLAYGINLNPKNDPNLVGNLCCLYD